MGETWGKGTGESVNVERSSKEPGEAKGATGRKEEVPRTVKMKKYQRQQRFSQGASRVREEGPEKKDRRRQDHRGPRGAARQDRLKNDGKEFAVEVRRVGTGYRVHQEEEGKRRFDVGYADRKRVTRPRGVVATRDSKNTGLVVKANDERRREPREWVKMVVMNAVASMEKVRPLSPYSGSGVVRAEQRGKRKLKSTKSTL